MPATQLPLVLAQRHNIAATAYEIYVLAVGIKDGNRLLIGGEEFEL